VLEGLHRNGLAQAPVFAVETLGADSLAQAMRAGEPVELPSIASIATSLGARRVADAAFSWTRKHPVHSHVVTDQAAVAACLRFLDDHRTVVEPACGASLALAYDGADLLEAYDNVLVIVCGGVTATVAQLQAWNDGFSQRISNTRLE
jgi:L-serine/L-threonine ammonia-lyase